MRGLRLPVWGAACLLACALASRGHAEERAGWCCLGETIRAVTIQNDAPVDVNGLLALVPLRIGEALTEENLKRAEHLLREREIFESVELVTEPDAAGVRILLVLARRPILHEVRVDGVKNLRRRDVDRLIRISSGTLFDPEAVAAAARRLQTRYHREGFPAATVTFDPYPGPRRGETGIRFLVVEGDPETIVGVGIDRQLDTDDGGEPPEPPDPVIWDELQVAAENLLQQRKTRERTREARRAILHILRAHSYFEAGVEPSWHARAEEKAGTLRFAVRPGPPFDIEIAGNENLSRRTLLKQMDLQDRLIITDGTWRELQRRMIQVYQEAGYPDAAIELEVEGEARKRIRFTVQEGTRYAISGVRFQGNDRLTAEQLRAVMKSRPPRFFLWNWIPALRTGVVRDDMLENDRTRVRSLYRREGFEKASVAAIERHPDSERGRVELEVAVEEGLPTIVREVQYEGCDALDLSAEGLEVLPDRPFRSSRVREDIRRIRQAFDRLGYSDASVDSEVRREVSSEEVSAFVTFYAEPGVRRRIGSIVVQGNIDTRDRVILRELEFGPGEPLDTGALLEAQARVYQVGLFRSVAVRPLLPEEAAVRDVGVRVVERPPGRLEGRLGYNTRDGLGVGAEISYDNLQGLARRVSAAGEVAFDPTEFDPNQYLVNLGFREPRLRDSLWGFSANLITERATRTIDQYSIERVSAVNVLSRPLRRSWRVGGELQAEYSDIFDVAPDAVLTGQDEGTYYSTSLTPFVLYDGRDDIFSPSEGIFNSLRFRYVLPLLSSVHLGRMSAQHTHYVDLPLDLTFLYVVRGGWARTLDDTEVVPIRERFFLGGRNTVRGFSENSVGPKGQDGDPIGGDVMLNANVELRFPLVYGFRGAVFVDGGGVYFLEGCPSDGSVSGCTFSFDNFRRAAGFGLRYDTPVGPINLDYGIKLDPRPGESFGAVHFSIGSVF